MPKLNKTLLIIFTLFSLTINAQNWAHYQGKEESKPKSGKHLDFPYAKSLKTINNPKEGVIYVTNYIFMKYENQIESTYLNLSVAHYKDKGEIQLLFIPYENGTPFNKLTKSFLAIDIAKFNQLEYKEPLEWNDALNKVHIEFYSAKKEHIKVYETLEPFFNAHYYLDEFSDKTKSSQKSYTANISSGLFSISEAKAFCSEKWTKRGQLNKGLYDMCLSREKEAFKGYAIFKNDYKSFDWFENLENLIIEQHTKRGIKEWNMIEYSLRREIDAYLDLEYDLKNNNITKAEFNKFKTESSVKFPNAIWTMTKALMR